MFEIHRKRTYRCSIDRLWEAIATREGLAGWLMENDFEPTVGHRFTFRTKPSRGFDGIVHAEVLALSSPNHLRLAWRGGGQETEVAFTLEVVEPNVTLLRLAHTGFGGFSGLMTRVILGLGWGKLLRRLLPEWLGLR